MYSGPATIIQLGTLLTVGVTIVSGALFLAWRNAQQSGAALQRKHRRRRASLFKTFKPPGLGR